jgi:hypothetical protein
LLDQISDDSKAHMLTTLSPGLDTEHFRTLLEDPTFHIFYHAPVLILIRRSPTTHGSSTFVRWRPRT